MFAVAGYLTPIGFWATDWIDLDDAEAWMSAASIDLMAQHGYVIDGIPIASKDCMPIITRDAGLDATMIRHTGGPPIPDNEVRRGNRGLW